MSKTLGNTIKTFAKNLRFHAKSVVTGKESASDALKRLHDDSKKIAHMVAPPETPPENRRHAQKLVSKGRERFNSHDYEAAEKYFRQALAEDPSCCRACTYLGHSLYHQKLHKEALAVWKRAFEMDPASAAGIKAKKMLDHVERAQSDYISAYKERLGFK